MSMQASASTSRMGRLFRWRSGRVSGFSIGSWGRFSSRRLEAGTTGIGHIGYGVGDFTVG
jgi:hypothetical protein